MILEFLKLLIGFSASAGDHLLGRELPPLLPLRPLLGFFIDDQRLHVGGLELLALALAVTLYYRHGMSGEKKESLITFGNIESD